MVNTMTFDYEAFESRADEAGIAEYELAAKDLAAIIDGMGGKLECVPLLTRANSTNSEWDKSAVHRQCRVTFPRRLVGQRWIEESSFTCEYSAGSAHPIQWAEKHGTSFIRHEVARAKREYGAKWERLCASEGLIERIRAAWNPSLFDVVSSLLRDTPDPGMTFELWARELGYDEDSRKAERSFKACCEAGAFCRAAFGSNFETARALSNML
jgi:hypothetical protein